MTNCSEPILFVFCGPTASGKSTICQRLLQGDGNLLSSISTTTRKPRENEVEGVHYFFVDEEEFADRVDAGCFLEHAKYGGNCYGTELRNIELAKAQGKDLVLDIEVQGVEQLKELHPNQLVTTFIFPPSFSVLVDRLRERRTEDEASIQRRLLIARVELARLTSPGFSDYLLINDDLDTSVLQAQAIVQAERMRFSRLDPNFVTKLRN